MAVSTVAPKEAKRLIHGDGEVAVLDVREHGQYGEGHLLFASNCPYSRLELLAPRLVPNRRARTILCDDGDGVAERAAGRLAALGYERIAVLEGGAPAWREAGFELFKGVNVPSKALGELVEQRCHTPVLTPDRLEAWQRDGRPLVLVDGRPFAEFRRMTIPGARCVPNGELLYRLRALVADERTPVVIHCAGRTRGLIGAQSLIDAGVRNPVFALENGTQGWVLSGRRLDRGATSPPLPPLEPRLVEEGRALADQLARRLGVPVVDPDTVASWAACESRTLYLLDVRTAEEFEACHVAGARHAPAVQLVQATDEWVAVRRARLVLIDDNGVRATITASWLRQMGHDAHVVRDALAAMPLTSGRDDPYDSPPAPARVRPVAAAALAASREAGRLVVDLRSSMAHRQARIPGSMWAIRPRLDRLPLRSASAVTLVADDPRIAELAAIDLAELTDAPLEYLEGGLDAWRAGGGEVETGASEPDDASAIDYLFFVHDRHQGNLDASRRYLAWEMGLVDQMDEQERAEFRVFGQEEATRWSGTPGSSGRAASRGRPRAP